MNGWSSCRCCRRCVAERSRYCCNIGHEDRSWGRCNTRTCDQSIVQSKNQWFVLRVVGRCFCSSSSWRWLIRRVFGLSRICAQRPSRGTAVRYKLNRDQTQTRTLLKVQFCSPRQGERPVQSSDGPPPSSLAKGTGGIQSWVGADAPITAKTAAEGVIQMLQGSEGSMHVLLPFWCECKMRATTNDQR